MTTQRRQFIQALASIVASLTLPGCATTGVTNVPSSNGVVRLRLDEYPQLSRPGGHIAVQTEGVGPIYVMAVEAGGFVALSPICSHTGCAVTVVEDGLVCPCDGSVYDRIGRVVQGPAERSLRQFPLALTSGEVIIEVRAGGL